MRSQLINIVLLCLCINSLCSDPVLTAWPKNFFTWAVTTITYFNTPPHYNVGQFIAYDVDNQYVCGADQQDLLNPSSKRFLQLCDYSGEHLYMADNCTSSANCTNSQPLGGTLKPISWPTDFVKNAKFMGTNIVNSLTCNHFYAATVNLGGGNIVQVDAWVSVTGNQLPCEVVVTDLNQRLVTTWAFVGFTDTISQSDYNRCFIAKDKCRPDLLCQAKANATSQALIAALSWVCNPSILDCTPIQIGGTNYLPNTPKDHSNWAFNAYYQKNRKAQGPNACNFNGTAQLVDSPNTPDPEGSLTFTSLFASIVPTFVCPSFF